MTIDVLFLDGGRSAQEKPDPKYPNGMHVNLADSRAPKVCTRNLPYPAPRCGSYRITCNVCELKVLITVAGRPDDPIVITLPCKSTGGKNGKSRGKA